MQLTRPKSLTSLAGAAAIGYLAGTIPFADVAARLATGGTTDLRSEGSGNPGGANAAKVLGAKWGYGVMAADIAKSAVACRIGGRVAGDLGSHVAGTAAVIGHCFPVWNGFRGGKGVAASVGQCLANFPVYAPIDLAVAAATASLPGWKERALVGTATASACWVGGGLLWNKTQWSNGWGPTPSPALPVSAAISSAVILYRFAASPNPTASSQETSARAAADVVPFSATAARTGPST